MTEDLTQSTTDKAEALPIKAPGSDAVRAPKAGPADTVFTNADTKKAPRTLGLKLVDTLIYPVVNNIGVFVISVFATYLTHKGWPERADGKEIIGWKKTFGDFMKARGTKFEEFCMTRFNMNKKQADVSRMVFFSFADGTLIAPLIKVFEDGREKMAKGIDTLFGTKPKDEHAYDAEPKQTWGSVISGRLATSLIVVPTAVAFEKIKVGKGSFNDWMFKDASKSLSNFLRNKTSIAQHYPSVDIGYLAKTSVFESVYTSICTAGLYVISRLIAKKTHHTIGDAATKSHATVHMASDTPDGAEGAPSTLTAPATQPKLSIFQPTQHQRLVEPAAQELTA